MTRSLFGWSYPPGCSGPPEYSEPADAPRPGGNARQRRRVRRALAGTCDRHGGRRDLRGGCAACAREVDEGEAAIAAEWERDSLAFEAQEAADRSTLLGGVPGVHPHFARGYLRTVRLQRGLRTTLPLRRNLLTGLGWWCSGAGRWRTPAPSQIAWPVTFWTANERGAFGFAAAMPTPWRRRSRWPGWRSGG